VTCSPSHCVAATVAKFTNLVDSAAWWKQAGVDALAAADLSPANCSKNG
jgi:hypothetical protein